MIGTIWERIKAKSVRTDDSATVDNDSSSKVHLRIETDIGIQNAVRSDLTGFTDICSRIYCDIIPQQYAPTNHDIRTNVDTCSQDYLRINHGTGINTPGRRSWWEKVFQEVDETEVGIDDTDGWTVNRYVGRDQHCCGP
jgi:hypothetical protein